MSDINPDDFKIWNTLEVGKITVKTKFAFLGKIILRLGTALPGINFRRLEILPERKFYKSVDFKGFRLGLLDEAADGEFLEKCCRESDCGDPHCRRLPSSTSSSVSVFSHRNKKYVRKIFYHRKFSDRIKDLIRGTRAARSLEGDLLLRKFRFAAPKCLLIGKKGRVSFAVSEFVEDAPDLRHLIKDKFVFPLDKEKVELKRQIAKAAGRATGKLHALGIVHGDLRVGNILVGRDDSGGIQLWFLDNERTFRYKKLPEKLRVNNLVQINMFMSETIAKTDRMRFYVRYLKENPGLSSRKRSLAARVVEKTSLRMKKYSDRVADAAKEGNRHFSKPPDKKRN